MIETKFHLGDRVRFILPAHSMAVKTLVERGLSEEIATIIRCVKSTSKQIVYGIQFDNPHDFLHDCSYDATSRSHLFGERGRKYHCWWISENEIELAEDPINLSDLI